MAGNQVNTWTLAGNLTAIPATNGYLRTAIYDAENRMVSETENGHLRLYALEAHDFALSKLERNLDRDRDDVQQLARAGHLRPEILRERYYNALRPNLAAHEGRHDLTLQLWLE